MIQCSLRRKVIPMTLFISLYLQTCNNLSRTRESFFSKKIPFFLLSQLVLTYLKV